MSVMDRSCSACAAPMPPNAQACPRCGAHRDPPEPAGAGRAAPDRDDSAEQLARVRPQGSLLREFLSFIAHEKKWWLAPLLLVLVLVAALLIFSASSPLAPFLYPLF